MGTILFRWFPVRYDKNTTERWLDFLVAERRRGSAQSPCERLHADLVGPVTPKSNYMRYFILLTDEFSEYRWAVFGKTNSDCSEGF